MVAGTPLRDVAIVDDNEDARNTLADELALAHFSPRPLSGPFRSVEEVVEAAAQSAAAICDHHLARANYCPDTGAQAVAGLYERRVPAVLLTAWSRADFDPIRRFRRRIPVLLSPDDANPDGFLKGWDICKNEFQGRYTPNRKPWQAMVRIEEFDQRPVPNVTWLYRAGIPARSFVCL